jgi:hypothetical protein
MRSLAGGSGAAGARAPRWLESGAGGEQSGGDSRSPPCPPRASTARPRPGSAGRRGRNRAFQLPPAASVAAVVAWWGVLQARVVQLRHRQGMAAGWRQPGRPPRQRLPAVTVWVRCVSGGAPHRPLAPPQPVQLRRQRPGAVLQVQQVAVAVERPAVDAARPAAPVAGLRGAGTGVVGLGPAAAVVALVDARAGLDADLPGPACLPAGQQVSPPWPGCRAPTNPPGRRARPGRSRMAQVHRTPRRESPPGAVWGAAGDPTPRRPACPGSRFLARTAGSTPGHTAPLHQRHPHGQSGRRAATGPGHDLHQPLLLRS